MADRPARRSPSPAARLAAAVRRAAAAAAEPPEQTYDAPRGLLASQSRRSFLALGVAAVATAMTGWWLLPERAKRDWLPWAHDRLDTLAGRAGLTTGRRERALG